MKISQNKKNEGKYCCAYGCHNEPVAKKGGLCHKHYMIKMKEKDPVLIRYNRFRSKSKQRGIENSVTLEEFRKFCKRTGYIIVKGRRGMNATIDRRCNTHGYHIWNMQLLTHKQNSSKNNSHSENFDCPF